jgi:thioredoxin 2
MILTCPSCSAKNRVPASRLDSHPKCGGCKEPLKIAAPLDVPSEAEFDALIAESPLPVLVDFWAAWCGPCRAVAPQLAALAKSRAGHLVVAKVDSDAHPGLSARFNVQSIPTLILFREGNLVRRQAGAMNAQQIAQAFGV